MSGILVSPIAGMIYSSSRQKAYKKIKMLIIENKNNSKINDKLYYTYISGLSIGILIQAILAILTSILIIISHQFCTYMAFVTFILIRSLLLCGFLFYVNISYPTCYFGMVYGVYATVSSIF